MTSTFKIPRKRGGGIFPRKKGELCLSVTHNVLRKKKKEKRTSKHVVSQLVPPFSNAKILISRWIFTCKCHETIPATPYPIPIKENPPRWKSLRDNDGLCIPTVSFVSASLATSASPCGYLSSVAARNTQLHGCLSCPFSPFPSSCHPPRRGQVPRKFRMESVAKDNFQLLRLLSIRSWCERRRGRDAAKNRGTFHAVNDRLSFRLLQTLSFGNLFPLELFLFLLVSVACSSVDFVIFLFDSCSIRLEFVESSLVAWLI